MCVQVGIKYSYDITNIPLYPKHYCVKTYAAWFDNDKNIVYFLSLDKFQFVFSMKNLFTEDFGYLPEMLRSS
jgi:hypothetical protein